MREHLGWTASGRLPHFDSGQATQFITFGLADSLPKTAAFESMDDELDIGRGECLLKRPEIAGAIVATLRRSDGSRYLLHAFVVMPNHAHVLITQRDGHRLGEVIRTWKGSVAHRANEILGRNGSFWLKDYFDRYIRDDAHFGAALTYIHENPVKAGLCRTAADWPWSSASETKTW